MLSWAVGVTWEVEGEPKIFSSMQEMDSSGRETLAWYFLCR